jgi:hypothetical protein
MAQERRVRRLSQFLSQDSIPRLVLRKTFLERSEPLASQFELFDDKASNRDTLATRLMWTDWLVDSVSSGKPLPSDFMRIDLIFAEESRVVNSRLYPMGGESLAYLGALQLAIDWEDEDNPLYDPHVS